MPFLLTLAAISTHACVYAIVQQVYSIQIYIYIYICMYFVALHMFASSFLGPLWNKMFCWHNKQNAYQIYYLIKQSLSVSRGAATLQLRMLHAIQVGYMCMFMIFQLYYLCSPPIPPAITVLCCHCFLIVLIIEVWFHHSLCNGRPEKYS